MKWIEISSRPLPEHVQAVQEFLRKNGVENTAETRSPTIEEFPKVLEEAMKTADAVRIGSPYRQEALSFFPHLSTITRQLGAADCLIRHGGKWWPQNSMYLAMQQAMNVHKFPMNTRSHALVVGTGAYARVALATAIHIGFKKLLVSTKFDEHGTEFIREIRKVYFNVDFQFIPQNELVMLPGDTELLINTTPLNPQNDLLNELYYFNFLRPSGLVIDMTMVPLESPLVMGARHLGARFIKGVDVIAQSDLVWMEWVTGLSLDSADYQKTLEEHVSKVVFDLQPYQKILEQIQIDSQSQKST